MSLNNSPENNEYNDRYIYSDSKKTIKNKSLKNKKILFSFAIVFSVILGILGGAFIYAYHMLDTLNYQPMQDTDDTDYISGAAQDPMVLNVALFGVDRHAEVDVKSRSDSILILSLDSRRKKIKLTSLMRDMWVEIPGHGSNRINTAIAYGGESLAIKTIEQNFGVKIDRFCTVDFEGFKDIIDIIGGLDIEITKQEANHINKLLVELDSAFKEGGLTPFNSPLLKETDGVHHLNGAQALQYARSRKVPTAEGMHDDYARTFRQRRVISLVIDKLKTSSLPQLLNVIEKAGPYINTNLKKNEIITLGKNSVKYLQYELAEFRLPENDNLEGKNINGASVITIKDMNKARFDLAKFIYEDSVKESDPSFNKSTYKTTSENTYSSKSSQSSTSNAKNKSADIPKKTEQNTNSKSTNSKIEKPQDNNTQSSSPQSNSTKTNKTSQTESSTKSTPIKTQNKKSNANTIKQDSPVKGTSSSTAKSSTSSTQKNIKTTSSNSHKK